MEDTLKYKDIFDFKFGMSPDSSLCPYEPCLSSSGAEGVAISLRSRGFISAVPRQIRGQVGEGILLIGDEP